MSNEEKELTTSEEESSTSEEEDENGEEWTEDIEKTFLRTLSSLKRKDPKIYDASVTFFNDESKKEDDDAQQPSVSPKKAKKEEPMYLRDYERKIILEKGGILTDDESDESDDEKVHQQPASLTYVEEQKALKNSFKKFLTDDDKDNSEEDGTAGFLKVKVKSAREEAQENSEYVEWLRGHKSELNDKEFEGDVKYLRDYWTDPNLNEGESFLRDYVLNKKYLEANDENQFDTELSFSEEEKILNDCEEYEHKYNFRFEEPDQDFIKTYPRVIEDSLRRKDEKRRRKREERKKRKEENLEQKRLEVKRLKKQKEEEIMEKINKLKELTGNKTLGFDDEELERDFNPEEFDKKMNEIFNDEFYDKEADLDPSFDVEENSDDFNMDCDYDPEAARESKFKKQTRSSRRKGHKKTTFAESVQKEKPVFNPEDKTYQEYLDEYYGLDFEDIIDDMPCRFKYRNVTPNDFGLSIEEILAADDKELNKWCSMNKVDTIRSEQTENFDKKVYQKRGQNIELKKNYLPSLFDGANTAEEKSVQPETTTKNKKKKRRRKKSKNFTESDLNTIKQNDPIKADEVNNVEENKRKRKLQENSEGMPSKKKLKSKNSEGMPSKKKLKSKSTQSEKTKRSFTSSPLKNIKSKKRPNELGHKNSTTNFQSKNRAAESNFEISDERLKAYGFNPKKYKNKVKYGYSVS